jgi:DeoR family fructose operon transcriptional repressor
MCEKAGIDGQISTKILNKRSDVLPEERRRRIVEQVTARSPLRADELATGFGVSVETIRRDLLALQRDGLVRRIWGGVAGVAPRLLEPPYHQRRVLHLERKRAIARLAASLVRPGDTLILDVGTSVAELAHALPAGFNGRVLTNSLLAAAALTQRDGVEVRVSGGRVRAGGDLACSGSQAEAFFAEYFADRAFLGSGGVHPAAGLSDYHPDEVLTRRVMIDHAAERYVLADSSKLGQVAVQKVCDLDRLTAVLTDDRVAPAIAGALEDRGVRLLVAATDERQKGASA